MGWFLAVDTIAKPPLSFCSIRVYPLFHPRCSASKESISSLEIREALAEGRFPAVGLPRVLALGGGAAEGFFEGVVVA